VGCPNIPFSVALFSITSWDAPSSLIVCGTPNSRMIGPRSPRKRPPLTALVVDFNLPLGPRDSISPFLTPAASATPSRARSTCDLPRLREQISLRTRDLAAPLQCGRILIPISNYSSDTSFVNTIISDSQIESSGQRQRSRHSITRISHQDLEGRGFSPAGTAAPSFARPATRTGWTRNRCGSQDSGITQMALNRRIKIGEKPG